MSTAHRIAVAATLLAIAAFLFWTVLSLPVAETYGIAQTRVWAGIGGFLAVGGAVFVLLGIKRKRVMARTQRAKPTMNLAQKITVAVILLVAALFLLMGGHRAYTHIPPVLGVSHEAKVELALSHYYQSSNGMRAWILQHRAPVSLSALSDSELLARYNAAKAAQQSALATTVSRHALSDSELLARLDAAENAPAAAANAAAASLAAAAKAESLAAAANAAPLAAAAKAASLVVAAKAELARREELAKIGFKVTDTNCAALPTDTLERAKTNSYTDWRRTWLDLVSILAAGGAAVVLLGIRRKRQGMNTNTPGQSVR